MVCHPLAIRVNPIIRIELWQTKYDFRGGIDDPFEFAEKLRVKFGYTDYKHIEMRAARTGTTWTSDTYEGRIELTSSAPGPFKGQWGFQSVNGVIAADWRRGHPAEIHHRQLRRLRR